jgi:hypothetical protein
VSEVIVIVQTSPGGLVQIPPVLDLNQSLTLLAFRGPTDASGAPAVGPDGLPGGADDDFISIPTTWTADSNIGSIASPSPGSASTTASFVTITILPAGSFSETGLVTATSIADGLSGSASIRVTGPDVLVLEPVSVSLVAGTDQVFQAFVGPPAQDGSADIGGDGTPGTGDDLFELRSADWTVISDTGDIGTVSPATGTSTTLTTAASSGTGRVIGTAGGLSATAMVTVIGEVRGADLVFEDALSDTDEVELFRPGTGEAALLRGNQLLVRVIDALLVGLSGRNSFLAQLIAGVLNSQRDGASNRILDVIPPDVRYRVHGDGSDPTPATLVSLDAQGDLLQTYDLDLTPASSVESMPFVAVDAGGLILDGEFAGILFVAAEAGGTLVTSAEGYGDATATVVAD